MSKSDERRKTSYLKLVGTPCTYALNVSGLDSNGGHFTRDTVMNDVLDGDCLLSQVNTPNDTLKNTQSSTVQVDGLAQPLLVHFAILTQGCLKSLEFILEKRRPT